MFSLMCVILLGGLPISQNPMGLVRKGSAPLSGLKDQVGRGPVAKDGSGTCLVPSPQAKVG